MSEDRRRRDREFFSMIEDCVADESEIEVQYTDYRNGQPQAMELVVRSRQTDYVYKITVTPVT